MYSFELFLQSAQIDEIVVVCNLEYRSVFSAHNRVKPVHFAMPGARRQDSVFNGLKASSLGQDLILIHDAARPFIDQDLIEKVLLEGKDFGAATLGMPVKYTVKTATEAQLVANTPDRSFLWEIQTPQVVKREILEEGFRIAAEKGITVTDDVSLAELTKTEVKLVKGADKNIKITVPLDLVFANHLLSLQND